MLKDSRLVLLLAIIFAGSMFFYVQKVLIYHQVLYAVAHARPRGNLSDLYPRWLGARELLLHHRDPYSLEVTREIQMGYYGRPIDPNRPEDPKDQQGFAYPVYVVFLLAPTVRLSFAKVQSGMGWLLFTLTLASVPMWLRVLRWHPRIVITATLMVLAIGSFPGLQALKLQQLSLLVSGLIAACCTALVAGYFSLAGFLLAMATIKPQLTLPVMTWLVLWATSDWRQRWRFLASLGATMAVLVVASEYLLPGWVGKFRDAVAAYRQYTQGAGSILDVLISPMLGDVIRVAVAIVMGALGWRFRRIAHDSDAFSTMLALILAVTVMIVPMFAPYNQILLLPGILLIVSSWGTLWNRNRLTRAACIVCALMVVWPWLATCAMTLTWLFLPAGSLERAWATPLYTSLAIPIAVLGLLSVCAVNRLKGSNRTT